METHLEELSIEKNVVINEYLYYFGNCVDTEKLIKFIDSVLDRRFADVYTNFIWKQMIPYIISKNEVEKQQIKQCLEFAIYKIIGTYEEKLSYRFENAFELLVISCLYWYLCGDYTLLAQPVFEKGMVHLFYHKDRSTNWREDDSWEFFQEIEHLFHLLPKEIVAKALAQMQQSWLMEARILGRTFLALLPVS